MNDKKGNELKQLNQNKNFRTIYFYYRHTNMSCRAIAKQMNVHPSTVSRIFAKIKGLNSGEAGGSQGGNAPLDT